MHYICVSGFTNLYEVNTVYKNRFLMDYDTTVYTS